MLLVVEFLLLVWFLVAAEKCARERKWGLLRLAPLALIAGALVGVAGLTRYACGWLIVLFPAGPLSPPQPATASNPARPEAKIPSVRLNRMHPP